MEFSHFLYRVIGTIPLYLVAAVGLVLCLKQASTNPRTATLVGIAVVLFVLTELFLPVIVNLLFQRVLNDWMPGDLNMRILINSLVLSIPMATAWALMISAVFRTQPELDTEGTDS
ncbi:MAG: hypothetical protein CMJ78_17450 [Planctomycetaceae bacterium]|nr:hypothetical protein [Planctomycetaceae bacterium]